MPERIDGRNIYEICNYDVPYIISLKYAINKEMLVTVHYYGIYNDWIVDSIFFTRDVTNHGKLILIY